MKKNLFVGLIALTALTVTSCTNDEVNEMIPQGKAIEFNSYLGRDAQTRASVVESNNATYGLQAQGFGVLAYLHDGNTTEYTSANFMKNEKVSGATWDYTTKYWPTQAVFDESTPANTKNVIDFLAYGPYGSTNIAFDDNYSKTLTFTVPVEVRDQTDLVVATPVKNQTSTSNTVNPGQVNFTFNHMLSRIAFYAKAYAAYANTAITINSIKLTGSFASGGTVDLSAGTPTISGTPGSVTYILTATGGDAANLTGSNLTTTQVIQNKATDYLMVIPNLESQDLSVVVNYTVKNTIDNTFVTNEIPVEIEDKTFAAGSAYAINLTISLNAITFNVTEVVGWSNPEIQY